ncbi:two-partner secretion domain-containing protein [Celerinatantimonas diazotrophica]|uniref:Filamentous hemagglutinin family protein n=1 Tax=Celerinatantimonas diazotrophica TaxID=412034 RepID=A0A4R1K1W5_9GAMM|nr:filamentous hemagglutinin N-terminal domain-containing protein [Celerinatantimonas diazotrophica]TCK57900.1 filamentous hemagglutinin family protein [Celerinatantimonas diazotrophica]CAG9298032.1 hypothetical protein CEDIAZO_03227 [Celerinatantimonas diazotrophica]
MNHIYRSIWNAARQVWQVTSELGSRQVKSATKSVLKLAAGMLILVSTHVLAELPTGGQVVAGQGSIAQADSSMTIHQSSQNMVVNWNSFSIGKQNKVQFVQPGSSSAVLNRVTGSEVSSIRGQLSANGRVFLINPNGVSFSKNAQVNVGALVTSTLGISNKDFMSGHYTFSGDSNNAVINQGNITTAEGGYVAMIAAKIINTGHITTPKGATLMGAGSTVTLDMGGPVKIQVNKSLLDTYIEQGGAIKANGGLIYLTAKAADALSSSVINHTGISQAQTLSSNATGEIVLLGDMKNGHINVAGTLDASAPKQGNGGFVETSAAHVKIAANTNVTTLAKTGKTGQWLIDPTDFNIDSGSATQTSSGIGATTLSNNLGTNNVTLATSATDTGSELGDINVNAAVSWSSNNTLTLNAHNNININASINASGDSSGLALNYGGYTQNSTVTNGTDYNINAPVTLSGSNASLSINGHSYSLIHSLAEARQYFASGKGNYALAEDLDLSNLPTQTEAIIPSLDGIVTGLGHTVSHISISSDLYGNVGLFGEVKNDSIVRDIGVTDSSVQGYQDAGLLIGINRGTVHNVYAIGTVSGRYSVGGLIGHNYGNVDKAFAIGTVQTWLDYGSNIGGLVGFNEGSLDNVYTDTTTTVNFNNAGGIAGYNQGTINHAYAAGATISTQDSGRAAGIAPNGTVTNSYYATTNADGETINSDSSQGVGKTRLELAQQSTYSGWDTSIWSINGSRGNAVAGYELGMFPYLSGLTPSSLIQNVTAFNAGFGTEANPYQITRWSQLQNINNSEILSKGYHFTLENDLNSSSAAYNFYASNSANSGAGWDPIGDSTHNFDGYFNGQDHTISNLTIKTSNDGSGLFGYTSADSELTNLALTDINISGASYVGGLVGYNQGTISNTSVNGQVSASGANLGGLVGYNSNQATVSSSYSVATVTGKGTSIGGLVGSNHGAINTSYAASSVTGETSGNNGRYTGGLVGWNKGTITSTYATSTVNSASDHVGGLVGGNDGGSISQSYALGAVSGAATVGGLVGFSGNGGTTSDSYYATTNAQGNAISGYDSLIGQGYSYSDLHNASTYANWDISSSGGSSAIWRIYDDHTTPLLRTFLTAATLSTSNSSATQVYNGSTELTAAVAIHWNTADHSTFDSTLVSGNLTLDEKNVGARSLVNHYYSTQQGYDIITDSSLKNLTVQVTAKTLSSVSISARNKVYDGTTVASLNTSSAHFNGMIAGDNLTIASARGQFSDKNVATNKTVSISGITLGGTDARNYSFNSGTATTIADITPRPVTVSADNQSKMVGSPDPEFTYQTSCGNFNSDCGLVAGESLTGQLTRDSGENAGTYAITQGTLTNSNNPNYTLTYQPGSLVINPVPRTVVITRTVLEQPRSHALSGQTVNSSINTPLNKNESHMNVKYVSSVKDIPQVNSSRSPLYVVGSGLLLPTQQLNNQSMEN